MRFRAAADAAGRRLDAYLAAHLGVPRNQAQRAIRAGGVRVDGVAAKGARPLAGGEWIDYEPPAPEPSRVEPEEGELRVLYEDAWLVALDKPAGLTVHPGAGRRHGTLAHLLLSRYPEMATVGGPGRPGIVHRLDRGTSGVMVVARTAAAYGRLTAAFAARAVDKRYLAIVYGVPRAASGTIDAPIGRHPTRRQEMAVRPGGRPALTGWRLRATAAGLSLLELELGTGRTHQIRVHLKALRHPLVGDPVYGEARWKALARARQAAVRDFDRPALHAWRLGLAHPDDGRPLRFTAPAPADLRALWRAATGEPWPLSDG